MRVYRQAMMVLVRFLGQMVCRSETEPSVWGETVLASSQTIRQQSSGLSTPVGETYGTAHSCTESRHSQANPVTGNTISGLAKTRRVAQPLPQRDTLTASYV